MRTEPHPYSVSEHAQHVLSRVPAMVFGSSRASVPSRLGIAVRVDSGWYRQRWVEPSTGEKKRTRSTRAPRWENVPGGTDTIPAW